MSNKAVLFQWEDSTALRHHCGFCERPLSHPGARNSCFGLHSEPCHRFHQAMFMRGRSHTCQPCIGADEAHHRRHVEIAEMLREIYELCGEEAYICPSISTGGRGGEGRDLRPPDDDASSTSTSDNLCLSRKERKEAKRLEKAASRPKVLTQHEIEYINTVLHPKKRLEDDVEGPQNTNEIDEIERHLRYNANVYNKKVKRSVLKGFAKIQDAEVDFETEIGRILTEFRLSEPIKLHAKNCRLHGKEIKTFENLLDNFKKAVVEDLVLVKKDEMEVRMRRAGYLRYTNRTSFDIIEDRNKIRNWKTGERIVNAEEPVETPAKESLERVKEDVPLAINATPDLRHLTYASTRVSPVGKPDEVRVISHPSPLRPSNADVPTPNTLRITFGDQNKRSPVLRKHTQSGLLGDISNQNSTFNNQKARISQQTHPDHASESYGPFSLEYLPSTSSSLGSALQSLSLQPLEVQTAPLNVVLSPSNSLPHELRERITALTSNPTLESLVRENSQKGKPKKTVPEQPPISQKKAKKAKREVKRKERRKKEQEALHIHDNDVIDTEDNIKEPVSGLTDAANQATSITDVRNIALGSKDEPYLSAQKLSPEPLLPKATPPTPPTSPPSLCTSQPLAFPLVATTNRFHDWIFFVRHFIVDKLTKPIIDRHTCIHLCPYVPLGIPDCPTHEICTHSNPARQSVYLVHPSRTNALSTGPYNRLRGEKILNLFNNEALTKDRLLLVDECMLQYLLGGWRSCAPPRKLSMEIKDYYDGYKEGRLMRQETTYNTMMYRNDALTTQLSDQLLQSMQQRLELQHPLPLICFCGTPAPDPSIFRYVGVPDEHDIIECSYAHCEIGRFHRHCVRDFHPKCVSRWYCYSCDAEMAKEAEWIERWLQAHDKGMEQDKTKDEVDVGYG